MERHGCTRVIGSMNFSDDLEAGNDIVLGNPDDLPAVTFDPNAIVLCERSMNCVTGFTRESRWISNQMCTNQANPPRSVVIENLCSEITNHDRHFGSPYLPVLDEILHDVFGVVLEDLCNSSHSNSAQITSYLEEYPASDDKKKLVSTRNGEESVRNQLLDMLQMVDDRYSRCIHEFCSVISSFYVMGDPETCFAFKTMIYLNERLRNKIKNHLVLVGDQRGGGSSLLQNQWILQQLKRKGHQLWKPQRGLPERSVSVLRAWMFQNFIHPYPNDGEKQELAVKSGLARSQVSNWFINARVRLWKPLIEEMYVELRKYNNNDLISLIL